MDRPDLLYSVQELMRKMASPRAKDLLALERAARHTIKYPRMACRYLWTPWDSNIEVYGDASFAGCISTRKSTVGGVALWRGQFVKAWSKRLVVRAATEGVAFATNSERLWRVWSRRSGATAAIGMVHRLGLGKVRHVAVGDARVQHHVRSPESRISKTSGERCPNTYLRGRTIACNWVLVDG